MTKVTILRGIAGAPVADYDTPSQIIADLPNGWRIIEELTDGGVDDMISRVMSRHGFDIRAEVMAAIEAAPADLKRHYHGAGETFAVAAE